MERGILILISWEENRISKRRGRTTERGKAKRFRASDCVKGRTYLVPVDADASNSSRTQRLDSVSAEAHASRLIRVLRGDVDFPEVSEKSRNRNYVIRAPKQRQDLRSVFPAIQSGSASTRLRSTYELYREIQLKLPETGLQCKFTSFDNKEVMHRPRR